MSNPQRGIVSGRLSALIGAGFELLVAKPDVRCGSWLRDNALTQSVTVHDPVKVVQHGRFEHFFLLDDQGRL